MIHILGFPVKIPEGFRAYDILKYMNKTELERAVQGPMWIPLRPNAVTATSASQLYEIRPMDVIGTYDHLEYNNRNEELILYVKVPNGRYDLIRPYDNANFISYVYPRMIIDNKNKKISCILTFDITIEPNHTVHSFSRSEFDIITDELKNITAQLMDSLNVETAHASEELYSDTITYEP